MRYSFLLALCASGFSLVACGSDAKSSNSSTIQNDGAAGTQAANAGNGGTDNGNTGNPNGGTAGHDANGGASEGGVSNGGASSTEGGASNTSGGASSTEGGASNTSGGASSTNGGVGGDSASGSSGMGGATVDPNPPGSGAGMDGGSPDDPPPSSVDGGPGFIKCQAQMRGAVVCPDIYFPVCGAVDTDIVCIKAPCPTFEYHVYGNSCEACANEDVIGYWLGTCADNGK